MCTHWRPPDDPPPKPVPGFDRLIDDLIDLASAWAGVHLHGNWTVADARKKARLEIERLRGVGTMKREGL